MSFFDLAVVYAEYSSLLNNAVTQAENDQILNFSLKENSPQSTVKNQSFTATEDNEFPTQCKTYVLSTKKCETCLFLGFLVKIPCVAKITVIL